MNLLLCLSLILSPSGALFEPVHIHSSLTLEAEYLDVGTRTDRELMVFGIADFALLQSEVEVLNSSWELRVQDLINQHKESLSMVQQQNESLTNILNQEIVAQEANLASAGKEIESITSLKNVYKWLFIGASTLAAGTLIYSFSEK